MLLHLQMGAAHVRLGQFRVVEILRDLVCVSTWGNKKIGTPVASVSASSVQDLSFLGCREKTRVAEGLLFWINFCCGLKVLLFLFKCNKYFIVLFYFFIQLGFNVSESGSAKLSKLLGWSKRYMTKEDSDPEHFDVFSYITE